MTIRRLDLTPLAPGALALALAMMWTPSAQAQLRACQHDGLTRPGILEASLYGRMTPGESGNDLVIRIPQGWENKWSLTHSPDPHDNTRTDADVIDPSANAIIVPPGVAALVWISIQPPVGAPEMPTIPRRIRLATDLPQGRYAPVALAAQANHYRQGSETLHEVVFCIDNTDNPQTHIWSFGLLIGDEWYDPQIKNRGAGPPPSR